MAYNDIIESAPVVLVEFYATWCPHCRRMMPVVDDVKALLDGQVPVVTLDIDRFADEAAAQGVESVPAFIVYRHGTPVWQHTGETDADTLVYQVERNIS